MQIEHVIKKIIAALQSAQLYGWELKRCKDAVLDAALVMQKALEERDEIVIGIVGDDLCFGKDILFDLSRFLSTTIRYLKSLGIEKITFKRGMQVEEFSGAIFALTVHKDRVKADPVKEFSSLGITHIIVGKLTAEASADTQTEHKNAQGIFKEALGSSDDSLVAILNKQELNYIGLRFAMVSILDNLGNFQKELFQLATIKRYDPATGVHMINVAILAMYFSARLGFSHDDVTDIGIAALFHDIGKMYISRKILRKTDRLSQDEFAQITNHAVLGGELLLRYVKDMGILPVVVAYEHHLRYDMSGYPKSPFLKKPHVVSIIVSICDVYDALLSRRGYKVDYDPAKVYEIMSKEKNRAFDPYLLEKFFSFMGVWYVGSLLLLSDGRVAVVTGENEHDIFSPIVEVIFPQDKKEVIDFSAGTQAIKIQRYLDPLKEGKEYLHLLEGLS
ncbi:MAG: HD domain-containing protein [Candidatus Omnitrophica bacterium]|nr:HD domain-containing protein [Candidatus Omnitrophota bacterium]